MQIDGTLFCINLERFLLFDHQSRFDCAYNMLLSSLSSNSILLSYGTAQDDDDDIYFVFADTV